MNIEDGDVIEIKPRRAFTPGAEHAGTTFRLRREAFGAAASRLPQQPPSPELKAAMDRLGQMRVISEAHYKGQMLGAAMIGAGLGGCTVATLWAVLEAFR